MSLCSSCSPLRNWGQRAISHENSIIEAVSSRKSIEIEGLRHENPIPAASVSGNILMSSLLFGLEPHTRRLPDDIEEQCKLMFENVRRVMQAAGGTPENIIKMVVWVKDNAFKSVL